jgi:hypothetical protein
MARSVGFDRQTHYATSIDDLTASELNMFSIKLRKVEKLGKLKFSMKAYNLK